MLLKEAYAPFIRRAHTNYGCVEKNIRKRRNPASLLILSLISGTRRRARKKPLVAPAGNLPRFLPSYPCILSV